MLGGKPRAQRRSRISPSHAGWGPAVLLPPRYGRAAPAHSPGPVAVGSVLQPGSLWGQEPWEGLSGPQAQWPPPGKRPRGCETLGVLAALSEAPSPLLIVAAAMAWPGPFPAPQPGPVHTPYLGPGTWLMPRCPPGVFSSWGARHGRWRSGEAAEVLAWPAGPSRAPRPGLAGPLGRARRGAPRWERIGCPSLPPGRLRQCPDK